MCSSAFRRQVITWEGRRSDDDQATAPFWRRLELAHAPMILPRAVCLPWLAGTGMPSFRLSVVSPMPRNVRKSSSVQAKCATC